MRTPVVVHESAWLLALLSGLACGAYARALAPQWGAAAWAVGAGGAAAFLGSLWLHELAHAAVARRRGFRVAAEHLVAFGGMTTVDHTADRRTEVWAGVAGAAVTAGLAALCLTLAGPPTPASPLQIILAWTGLFNVAVTAFNLLPVFPFDGGRVTGRAGTTLGCALGFAALAAGATFLFSGAGWWALALTALGALLFQDAVEGRDYLRTSA